MSLAVSARTEPTVQERQERHQLTGDRQAQQASRQLLSQAAADRHTDAAQHRAALTLVVLHARLSHRAADILRQATSAVLHQATTEVHLLAMAEEAATAEEAAVQAAEATAEAADQVDIEGNLKYEKDSYNYSFVTSSSGIVRSDSI